jgi:hypothetical protein
MNELTCFLLSLLAGIAIYAPVYLTRPPAGADKSAFSEEGAEYLTSRMNRKSR